MEHKYRGYKYTVTKGETSYVVVVTSPRGFQIYASALSMTDGHNVAKSIIDKDLTVE